MTRVFLAYGPFDRSDTALTQAAATAGGELVWATTMAEAGLGPLPRVPDAVLLHLEAEGLDDFVAAIRTHPKLSTVPVLVILPRLTQSSALRAIAGGGDDFLSLDDVPSLLPGKLAAACTAASEPTRPTQCRVLLGDASPLHGLVLSRLLVQAGFDVIIATNAPDVRAHVVEDADLGLAILDLALPDCDPVRLVGELRQQHGDAIPPLIGMIHAGVGSEVLDQARTGLFRSIHDKRRPPDELIFLANEASVTDHEASRTAPRLLCAVLVGFRREDGRWEYGLSHNISTGGLYVRTIAPPPQGATLEIELTPPESSTAVTAQAMVAWRKDFSQRAARTAPTGMGLKLVNPTTEAQEALARAAHHLARHGSHAA